MRIWCWLPAAALLAVLQITATPVRAKEEKKPQLPNILFMLSDDQSWNGLSVAMHPEFDGSRSRLVETPDLAKLATQGMRFSMAYSPAPVCSPTRISLQTGRSPAALHWTKAGPNVGGAAYKLLPPRGIKALPAGEVTFAELLRGAGYATAHFGKWHLSGGGPGTHGYDVHDGDLGNEHAAKFKDPNPVDIFGMTDRAIAFMKKCRKAKKPFFIQMSWHALHSPENALKATIEKVRERMAGGKTRRIARVAIAEDLDTGVGRLLAALDGLDLAKSTFVIYTSDNGGGGGGGRKRAGRAAGLSGGKGSLSEGGIRVPLIVRGPGVKANSWCHVPVTGMDFFPTFLEWAGIERLPKSIEGGSIAKLLAKEGKGTVRRPREEIVFHFPHYQSDGGPQSAILVGSMKLLRYYEDGRVALFDLSRDLTEKKDLSGEMPKMTADLTKRLAKYLEDVKAGMPTPNPRYDPDRAPPPGKRGGRKSGR